MASSSPIKSINKSINTNATIPLGLKPIMRYNLHLMKLRYITYLL